MKRKSVLPKVIAITAAMLILAGQCFAAADPFADISNTSGRDKIISLYEQGIIKGTGGGQFMPQTEMTAAQGIQLLVNAFDLNIDNIRFIKAPQATDYFKNAKDDAWYSNALIIISFSGLELPYDMDPNSKLTREEFTHYLVKVMEKQGNLPMINLKPVDIKDESQINILFSGSIQRAITYKLIQLDADGSFLPKETVTREYAAVQVYNAMEYLKAHPAPSADRSL